jgi:TRAP-type mannitol/chloroaromatic compound transport system permease large subunit
MVVRHIKEFTFPFAEPFFPFVSLAFGTVPVAATVVTDMDMVALWVIAFINMSAQFMGPAFSYGIQCPLLPGIERKPSDAFYVLLKNGGHFILRPH